MLIRRGRLDTGARADVRIEGTRIVAVSPELSARRGEEVIDADGGAVLAGLHDHHLHLRALAAALHSIAVGPPDVRTAAELAARLRREDRDRPSGAWLRAVDYHESVAGELDRHALDGIVAGRPVRVQHASGALWMLNSAAVDAIGVDASAPPGVERDIDGRPTGRIWREDRWLGRRLPATAPDLAAVGRAAAARGVTGFTDATPQDQASDVADLAHAAIPQRLHLLVAPGARLTGTGRVTLGAVKVILDDDRLPDLDTFVALVQAAHDDARPVAVHCVTRVQAVLTLAAIDAAGSRPGDRMEHGAVLGVDQLDGLRRLGVAVVTQPGFVSTRGDRYRRDVDPADRPDLWRLASLLDAGIGVAASTDAPYGDADPWAAIRAATDRLTRRGHPLGRDERIALRTAVALFAGRPEAPTRRRQVRAGEPADLCVLTRSLEDALEGGGSPAIAATIIDGAVVHALSS